MSVYLLMAIVMGISGFVMAFGVIGHKKLPARFKLHDKANPKVMQGKALYMNVIPNSMVSTLMLFTWVFLFEDIMFYAAAAPVWRIVVESVAVLLLYDFLYYLLHRYPFHEWPTLKRVHAVHHRGKYPTAHDSIYLHPVEGILGVLLFNLCVLSTAAIGGISVWSYAVIFFFYTQLNIIVHWGLELKTFPLNIITYMSKKHDRHHKSMREGNYASITPLPDWLFGTLVE